MSSLVPPSLYAPIFQWVVFVLVLIMAARCKDESIYKSSIANSMSNTGKVLVLAITLIVGFRPVSGYFGDTVNYAAGFINRQASGQADFCTASSIREGFGMGVIEASAMGNHNCDGVSENSYNSKSFNENIEAIFK